MSEMNNVIIVTGGRSFNDADLVARTLSTLSPSIVVHGGCSGADALADAWARANGIAVGVFRADWRRHGRAAGPIRNRQMLQRWGDGATLVAFPGGRGTASCVAIAGEMGVEVLPIVEKRADD